MGNMRNAHKFFSENLKGRGQPEDIGVDGRIIVERFLQK
jgi:hypothetical protein